MTKKRYTVKEAKAIAAAAGYELIHREAWGERFYTISLNGEDKVNSQKLTTLMQWIEANPVSNPVSVEEEEEEEEEVPVPAQLTYVPAPEEKEIVSKILKHVFNAEVEGRAIARLDADGTTVVVVTPHALYSIGQDYFRQLVEQTKTTQDPEEDRGSGCDADYVMQLEASLEQSETQSIQQERFSQVTASTPYGIEVDSIKPDSCRIWAGPTLLGTLRRTSVGWMARPVGHGRSWHVTPDNAQHAVISAALPY